jgi:hypothetical protein
MICGDYRQYQSKKDSKKMGNHQGPPNIGKRIDQFLILGIYLAIDVFEFWHKSHFWTLVAALVGVIALLLLDGGFSKKQITISAAIGMLICLVVYFVAPPPEPTIGWLQAANEPTPANGCGSPKNGVLVVLGDNGAMFDRPLGIANKRTALALGNCPLVSLQEGENGALIDATIYNWNGKLIAQIVNNKFSIAASDGLTIERSGDLSTLIVHDAQGQELLYVRHLNQTAFRIRGVFSCPTPRPRTIIITDSRILGMPMRMSCVANSGRAGFFIQ